MPRKYDGTFILDANYDHNSIVDAILAIVGKPFSYECNGQIEQQNRPRGVFLDNKTFITFYKQNFHPVVSMFNHVYKQWSGPVQCGTTPQEAAIDGHASPCIIDDAQGYLHVFFGCHDMHGFGIKHSKSTNPKDISSWTVMSDLVGDSHPTYPNALRDPNGTLWLVYRDTALGYYQARITYIKSTDNGSTWTSPRYIIGPFTGQKTIWFAATFLQEGSPQKIHIIWTYWDYTEARRHAVYHAYLNCSDDHMYSQNGTDLGTEISEAEGDTYCTVYNSGTLNEMALTVKLTGANVPYILFCREVSASDYRYSFTKWTGSAWSTPINLFPNNVGSIVACADMIITDANNIEIYLGIPTMPLFPSVTSAYGDILKMVSDDAGVTWITERILCSGRLFGTPLYNPEVIGFKAADRHAELKVVFAGLNPGDIHNLGGSVHWCKKAHVPIFGWGEDGFV